MKDLRKEALVWAEIDLNALAHNVRELRRITRPGARLMAVVKADGYGHGAAEVARQALGNGADFLGVARVGEGSSLRQAGVSAPILVFGYTPAGLGEQLIRQDLTQTVYSLASAGEMSEVATACGNKIRVHIKVDTGMGRLGVISCCGGDDPAHDPTNTREAAREIQAILRLPGLEVEGLYTHFAGADLLDKSYARQQLDRFAGLVERLRHDGVEIELMHAANSAALIDMPESHLDLVRPGISLYGLYPSDQVDRRTVDLKPAMELKARIIQLKEVPAGFKVSYGMTHETRKPARIATVSIGYADGLRRALSSRGRMLAGGRSAPIAGRVCMDLTMLDVSDIDGLRVGDEVVIFGRQGQSLISVDEIASELRTINYEVVTTITGRVPRIYLA